VSVYRPLFGSFGGGKGFVCTFGRFMGKFGEVARGVLCIHCPRARFEPLDDASLAGPLNTLGNQTVSPTIRGMGQVFPHLRGAKSHGDDCPKSQARTGTAIIPARCKAMPCYDSRQCRGG